MSMKIDFLILKYGNDDISFDDMKLIPELIATHMKRLGATIHVVNDRHTVRIIKPEMLVVNTFGLIMPSFWNNPEKRLIVEELLLTYQYANKNTAALNETLTKIYKMEKGIQ